MKKFIPLILVLCYIVYLFFFVSLGEEAPNIGAAIFMILLGGGFVVFDIYYNIQDNGKWYKFHSVRGPGKFIMFAVIFLGGLSMLVEFIKWHIMR